MPASLPTILSVTDGFIRICSILAKPGLAKYTAQLFTLFAFANLGLAGRRFPVTESRNLSSNNVAPH